MYCMYVCSMVTTIYINDEIIKKVKEKRLNVSLICREALAKKLEELDPPKDDWEQNLYDNKIKSEQAYQEWFKNRKRVIIYE